MRERISVKSNKWFVFSGVLLLYFYGYDCPVVHAQQTSGLSSLINSLAGRGEQNADIERATILHAGQAVRLTIPASWNVRELAVGRRVRLLISPQPIERSAVDFADGLWLELDYHPEGLSKEPGEQLRKRCESSLQTILGERLQSVRALTPTVGDSSAIGLEFQAKPASSVGDRSTQLEDSTTGIHCVVQTSWCRCWIHMQAPTAVAEQRMLDYEGILQRIRLEKPTAKDDKPIASVRAAATILGSWKASASRLRLFADGTVVMAPDKPFLFTTKDSDQPQKGSVVNGQFRARDDLLYIEWTDESKLNYRWSLRGNQLLLTDHEGRIAQLARISE